MNFLRISWLFSYDPEIPNKRSLSWVKSAKVFRHIKSNDHKNLLRYSERKFDVHTVYFSQPGARDKVLLPLPCLPKFASFKAVQTFWKNWVLSRFESFKELWDLWFRVFNLFRRFWIENFLSSDTPKSTIYKILKISFLYQPKLIPRTESTQDEVKKLLAKLRSLEEKIPIDSSKFPLFCLLKWPGTKKEIIDKAWEFYKPFP